MEKTKKENTSAEKERTEDRSPKEHESKQKCYSCGNDMIGMHHKIERKDRKGKTVVEICDNCYSKINQSIKISSSNINYRLAIMIGLLFSIIGAVLWFAITVITKWEIGIVAVGVGLLAGYGVKIGSGNKLSQNLQIISGAIAFISIIAGEYLIANYYVVDYFKSNGLLTGFTFLNPIKVFRFIFLTLKENPLTLLFWGIAVWSAFTVAKPLKLKKVG